MQQLAAAAPFTTGADHVDIKTVEGEVALREFLSNMFAYQPGWITFLYRLRAGFVRLLGMRQHGIPQPRRIPPAEFPFATGTPAAFFTVAAAEEERHWFAEITERHLKAMLGVVAEPANAGRRRFHVITIVHYRHWTGPVYFNVIRPFHHLVVGKMARAGVTSR